MTSNSRDVLDWSRERWLGAQQELLSLAEAGKWTKVLALARTCAQWTYQKGFPEPDWDEYALGMGSSYADSIRVSAWSLASAVARAMRKAKPMCLDDLRAFSRAVRHYRGSDEKWNHSSLKRLADQDVEAFVTWASDSYEALRKRSPHDSRAGILDDIAFLQDFECHDAADRLGRESGLWVPMWVDLTGLQRGILGVLGNKGKPMIGRDIAAKMDRSKNDLERSEDDIGRPLSQLRRMGILSNKRGVGYEVKVWPDGTPATVHKPE